MRQFVYQFHVKPTQCDDPGSYVTCCSARLSEIAHSGNALTVTTPPFFRIYYPKSIYELHWSDPLWVRDTQWRSI